MARKKLNVFYLTEYNYFGEQPQFSGLKRWFLRVRAVDLLLSVLTLLFITGILVMNTRLSAKNSHRQLSPVLQMANVEGVNVAPLAGKRVRRNVDDGTWEVPAEAYPIALSVTGICEEAIVLSEFPNGTCFSYCTASSCGSDALASIESGDSELVCTARIMQLGFQRSGTGEISRWIKQHPDVTARYADMFLNDAGQPEFDFCPIEQIRDTTSPGYFESYPLSSVGTVGSQKNYYVHCEHCLTTGLHHFNYAVAGQSFVFYPKHDQSLHQKACKSLRRLETMLTVSLNSNFIKAFNHPSAQFRSAWFDLNNENYMIGCLKRWFLRVRAVDLLLSVLTLLFITGILVMNTRLSAKNSHRQLSPVLQMANVEGVNVAPLAGKRVRRNVDDGTWEVPAEAYPIALSVTGICEEAIVLSEFPNGTCFSYCTASSCGSDALASIESGDSELVCTARIMQLGFQRSGTGEISRWIKQHPDVTARYADMFLNDAGQPEFDFCPIEQIRDTTSPGYFESYPLSSVGTVGSQKNYYVHCEHCLTTGLVYHSSGSFFVDLPTAMLPFTNQKFIITIKNPTDRAIAEYFYPYIVEETDLDTVGNQVLHDAMSAAIDEAKNCMTNLGPTGCVYSHNRLLGTTALAETQMLYDGCYSTHLAHVLTQISNSQTYFVKIEEYSASSGTVMQEVYNFVGLKYFEPPAPLVSHSTVKPIYSDTIIMMDAFFEPFNRELRDLLGDDKWLYTR
ncbi:uncharacterized protein [Watersipora subatra]|uniref:uncharacterized protein n=1 Tax=Watersipora subatra TaxID=2589382 RepID=UPI00355BAEDC